MIIKDSGGDFRSVEPGTHIARCVSIIGIGTHEREWQGVKRLSSELVITWELPFELMDDGRPFVISAFYTRSLHEKSNLRHALKNWRGRDFTPEELRGFELRNVLDKGCQVVCAENDKGKVRVTSVAGMPKGTALPNRVNDLKYFDPEEWDDESFNSLSDGMKKLLYDSFEYAEYTQTGYVLDSNERHINWKSQQGEQQYSGTPNRSANAAPAGFAPSQSATMEEPPF
jgi:hypothetical protein